MIKRISSAAPQPESVLQSTHIWSTVFNPLMFTGKRFQFIFTSYLNLFLHGDTTDSTKEYRKVKNKQFEKIYVKSKKKASVAMAISDYNKILSELDNEGKIGLLHIELRNCSKLIFVSA